MTTAKGKFQQLVDNPVQQKFINFLEEPKN